MDSGPTAILAPLNVACILRVPSRADARATKVERNRQNANLPYKNRGEIGYPLRKTKLESKG